MYFVYILESEDNKHWYIGMTDDLERRLAEHNAGKSLHTSKWSSWRLKSYIALTDHNKALRFEQYLKSHSGRAFTKKRL